jgi:hypothetical protein
MSLPRVWREIDTLLVGGARVDELTLQGGLSLPVNETRAAKKIVEQQDALMKKILRQSAGRRIDPALAKQFDAVTKKAVHNETLDDINQHPEETGKAMELVKKNVEAPAGGSPLSVWQRVLGFLRKHKNTFLKVLAKTLKWSTILLTIYVTVCGLSVLFDVTTFGLSFMTGVTGWCAGGALLNFVIQGIKTTSGLCADPTTRNAMMLGPLLGKVASVMSDKVPTKLVNHLFGLSNIMCSVCSAAKIFEYITPPKVGEGAKSIQDPCLGPLSGPMAFMAISSNAVSMTQTAQSFNDMFEPLPSPKTKEEVEKDQFIWMLRDLRKYEAEYGSSFSQDYAQMMASLPQQHQLHFASQ